MGKVLESAKRHLELAERFGRQARQELTHEEVTEIARMAIEQGQVIAALRDKVRALENQMTDLRKQRDSANGKLSALRKQVGKT